MDRWVCEFRSAEGDPQGIEGHASVFGQVAKIRNGLERIDPAAFNRALREGHEVSLLVNHAGLPLASTANGSLELRSDEVGLFVRAERLPETTLGNDVRILMREKLLTKMSFGFIPKADRRDQVNGRQVRTITDLDLFDVSIVTNPAYSETSVSLRSIDEYPALTLREQTARIRWANLRKGE